MASKRALRSLILDAGSSRPVASSQSRWYITRNLQRRSPAARISPTFAGIHTTAPRLRAQDKHRTAGNAATIDPEVRSSPATDHDIKAKTASTEEAVKLTLPSFSLSGRTIVITGGARGLGLVMGQGIVASGADVAIVDLNGEFGLLTKHLRFPDGGGEGTEAGSLTHGQGGEENRKAAHDGR
jgi:hypothetical protein